MQEKDINKARELLKTKRDLRAVKAHISKKVAATTVQPSFPFTTVEGEPLFIPIEIRTGVLHELLDKELAYVDRMLKSLGVTELT